MAIDIVPLQQKKQISIYMQEKKVRGDLRRETEKTV